MKKTWLASASDADKSVSLYVLHKYIPSVVFFCHWYSIGILSLKLLFFSSKCFLLGSI